MKITMRSYEGKEVTFEVDEHAEEGQGLEVLCRYLAACGESGDREVLMRWGVWDKVDEDEDDLNRIG